MGLISFWHPFYFHNHLKLDMQQRKISHVYCLLSNCLGSMTHSTNLALATLALCFMTAANAQTVFPVAAPTAKIGQITTFRTVDLWNNKELSVRATELVAIEAENMVMRTKTVGRDEVTTARTDKSWNFCRSMRGSEKSNCEGALKFPMQVGSKHNMKERAWPDGTGYDNGTCEVQAEEKITVPAGSFDTLRVVCSGWWTKVFEGSYSGRFNQTVWYAPSISNPVKFQVNIFHSRGQLDIKNQTELVEFVAGN